MESLLLASYIELGYNCLLPLLMAGRESSVIFKLLSARDLQDGLKLPGSHSPENSGYGLVTFRCSCQRCVVLDFRCQHLAAKC